MSFGETLRALSDPARQRILEMLKNGKMTAGEISGQFDSSAATISYHLSQLKKAGLLRESKVKNYIYYELDISVLEEVMLWIKQFQGGNSHETK